MDPIAEARALINSWLSRDKAPVPLKQPKGDAINTKFGQIPFKGPDALGVKQAKASENVATYPGYQREQARGGFDSPPSQFDFAKAGEMIGTVSKTIKELFPDEASAASLLNSITSSFSPPPTNESPNMWKQPTNEVLRFNDQGQIFPDAPAPTATPFPSPVPTATPSPATDGWSSKYQTVWESALNQKGITDKSVIKLIVQSENGKEDPQHINDNGNGTVDVGLGQINVSKGDTEEIERLKNPEYNIQKATDIWNSRLKNLEDPVLALASYNLGAGGAVLNPEKALARSKELYAHSGIPLPETEFTQNPLGFVRARMDKYKKLGLFKSR